MGKWMVMAKRADFNAIAEKYKISPIVARIIRNRDIEGDENIERYLHGTLKDLYNPFLLKDMDKAVKIILEKINDNKKICIIGDYDIDGVCSSYILYKGLKYMGVTADTVIPHRVKDGYGLNDRLILDTYEAGADTIITCDNGIAAFDQIEYANTLGMTVIITDHHEIPYEDTENGKSFIIPNAAAVIDPKQEDCEYPFKEICGAMVAYKLIIALISQKEGRDTADVMSSDIGMELMEFAAFATIGDVMELKDENRIVVKHGLGLIARTKNIGMKALMDAANIDSDKINTYTIGFVLGPCINATGRLDTALNALKLFKSESESEAVTLASDLKAMNDSRKDMTVKGVDAAISQIENHGLAEDKVLVVYLPEVHESLAGIIAGRIREKYSKPTFILTKSEDGVKGSGRSIEAFHMYDEMTKCKELFTKYGGHKMAAGLSLPEENVIRFRNAMNDNCTLTEEDFEEKVLIDIAMPFMYAGYELIKELEILEPFGNGNAKPLFAHKNAVFLRGSLLGAAKNVGKYTVCDENGSKYELIYFGNLDNFHEYIVQKYGQEALENLYEPNRYSRNCTDVKITLSVAYYPEINSFRGKESIQMVMKYYC